MSRPWMGLRAAVPRSPSQRLSPSDYFIDSGLFKFEFPGLLTTLFDEPAAKILLIQQFVNNFIAQYAVAIKHPSDFVKLV